MAFQEVLRNYGGIQRPYGGVVGDLGGSQVRYVRSDGVLGEF